MRNPKNPGKGRVENGAKPTTGKGRPEPLRRGAEGRNRATLLSMRTDELFFAVSEKATDIIMIVDVSGKILYINGAGSKLREKNTPGESTLEFLLGELHSEFKQAIEESLTTGVSVVTEQPGPKSTWWLVRLIPIQELRGLTSVVVVFCADITDHRRIEEETIRLNRVLAMVGKCNEILVRSSKEDHFLNDACRAIADVGGYRLVWVGLAEHDKARTIRPVAHAGFENGYLQTISITWADSELGKGPTGTAIRTGKSQVMRNILQDPLYAPWRNEALKRGYASSAAIPMISEGQVLGALNVYSHDLDAFGSNEVKILMELGGDLAYGIKSLRNKAERNRMAKELIEHENKLKALAMELALAEEHERRRIAVGIHDDIAQKLVMAKFELQKLQYAASDPDISGTLGSLADRIEEMVEDARSLTFELSSPLLYTIGLSAAVESWLDQRIQKEYGIDCDFVSNLSALCLEVEVRITLFQVIRELLTNAVKHAKAKNVKVSMREVNDRVEITIEDDGVGFDIAKVFETPLVGPDGHFGLFNVRERIDYLGGSFDIWSAPERGTRVTITVAKKYSAPVQAKPR